MTNTGLGFGVLGPLLMTVNGARMPLGAPKQRAVLAMLVLNRNRPVSVDSLITAVWDEEPVPAARSSIQSHVSTLRRLLRTAGADPNQVLASVPPGYQLCVADADCDLGRFLAEKAAGAQAAAAGRFDDASSHLSAALREWRGPVLDDLRDFTFVDAFATALVEDKVAVHTARAEAEIACGRPGAVIGELEALTVEHPYHEPLWAQLITAYYVTERQSDALRAYRRLKTGLAERLGIDPGPTVSALHERILRQEPLGTKRVDLVTHERPSAGVRCAVARQHRTPVSAKWCDHPDRAP
jgi:SARP family transcriptional regulator, regulator of embCAB operon